MSSTTAHQQVMEQIKWINNRYETGLRDDWFDPHFAYSSFVLDDLNLEDDNGFVYDIKTLTADFASGEWTPTDEPPGYAH